MADEKNGLGYRERHPPLPPRPAGFNAFPETPKPFWPKAPPVTPPCSVGTRESRDLRWSRMHALDMRKEMGLLDRHGGAPQEYRDHFDAVYAEKLKKQSAHQ